MLQLVISLFYPIKTTQNLLQFNYKKRYFSSFKTHMKKITGFRKKSWSAFFRDFSHKSNSNRTPKNKWMLFFLVAMEILINFPYIFSSYLWRFITGNYCLLSIYFKFNIISYFDLIYGQFKIYRSQKLTGVSSHQYLTNYL